MLSLFRTNQFIFNLFLLFYALIIRFSVFISPPAWNKDIGGVLSHWVLDWLGREGLGPGLLATFLVFFQGILVNVIVSRYRMADEITLFPGIFYILLASVCPEFLSLNPILMANTFYLLALNDLFQTYRKYAANDNIYNTGFWIAIATLFYFSFIHLLVLAFIGLSMLRAFKFRERMVLLVGLFTPFFLLGTYSFLADHFLQTSQLAFQNHLSIFNLENKNPDLLSYLKIGFFGILLLTVIFSARRYAMKKNIQVQKYLSILYWSLLLAGISIIFQRNIGLEGMLTIVPALGIFLSFNFLSFKKPVAEALHFVILFIAIILQLLIL